MDMREKVARALAVADGKDPDAPAWVEGYGARAQTFGICWRDQYGVKARAVLDALREPTEEMVKAGYDSLDDRPSPAHCWQAMIAKA